MSDNISFKVFSDDKIYNFELIDKSLFLKQVEKLEINPSYKQVDFKSNISINSILWLINKKPAYDWNAEEKEQVGIKLIDSVIYGTYPDIR